MVSMLKALVENLDNVSGQRDMETKENNSVTDEEYLQQINKVDLIWLRKEPVSLKM